MIGTILAAVKSWLWVAGIAVLAVAVALIRKSGADAERLHNAQLDVKASRTVQAAKTEAHGASDAALNAEVDKWSRK